MSEAWVRARLLSRMSHDLRTPLARIVALAAGGGDGDARQSLRAIESLAQRHLEWLADLQQCARCEVQPPEVTPAPTYLHRLLLDVEHAGQPLPGLAMLDARLLTQVLAQLGPPLQLRTSMADGMLALRFSRGEGHGPWQAVQGTLDDGKCTPGLLLAMHLVDAMGGVLQQSAHGLRFEIRVPLADEADAMPPAPRFVLPPPFGAGSTVLVLEPQAAMREYVADILESAAFEVCFEEPQAPPALVVRAQEESDGAAAAAGAAGRHAAQRRAAPVLLHAALPPQRPQDFAAILYKPAPPEALLQAARRALSQARVHP